MSRSIMHQLDFWYLIDVWQVNFWSSMGIKRNIIVHLSSYRCLNLRIGVRTHTFATHDEALDCAGPSSATSVDKLLETCPVKTWVQSFRRPCLMRESEGMFALSSWLSFRPIIYTQCVGFWVGPPIRKFWVVGDRKKSYIVNCIKYVSESLPCK